MIYRLIKSSICLLPFILSGCLTLVDDGVLGEQKADAEVLKTEVNKLRDQVAEMRQSLGKVEEEMQSMQTVRGSEIKDLKLKLDEIEKNLKSVESSHDQLKKEIIDELAKKIEKLPAVTAQTPVKSSGKSGSPRPDSRKKEVEKGYEHVVKPGENLSEIAAAYGVAPAVIIKANNLSKPNSLRAGQKLFIPE